MARLVSVRARLLPQAGHYAIARFALSLG
jgi:hypothetical protein